MLGFRQDYPQAGIVELTQNYRSTPEIVTAAGRLIAANKSRFIKKAQAVSPSGEPVFYRGYSTRDEENESIATAIARFPEGFKDVYKRQAALPRQAYFAREAGSGTGCHR